MITKVYETYTPTQVSKVTGKDGNVIETPIIANDGIINDIKKIEAVCEIESKNKNANGNITFNDIKLGKNEVIKFRAPNLITTQTFPAYVYYRFEKGNTSTISGGGATKDVDSSGAYATAMPLISFINDDKIGVEYFFTKLFRTAGRGIKTFTAKKDTGDVIVIDQANQLQNIFNSAVAVEASKVISTKVPATKFYFSPSALQDDLKIYFETNTDPVTFQYYPLYVGTMDTWSECVRSCYEDKYGGKKLPGNTTLWRLSSTSSYPKGKLIIETGQRLYAQSGEFLQNNQVGNTTFICTYLGDDPTHSKVTENSDLELRSGDKLFIHYTPSSTNEDGETVNAEPVSLVFTGGDANNPVILRPSGFTLIPSEDVYLQGTSWKKTDVDFGKHGKKNLLALAPNEQIEMRSISRVIIDKPAMFYKNFDNERLELGHSSESYSYELKDGEYIFYTDQNTQEAAYYGSGSVITLAPRAYIPKAKEIKEVSDILEQGLHTIPWSNYVLLNDSVKVTITEYQYVTLTEGDTLNILAVDSQSDSYTLNNARWTRCLSTDATPVTYTLADSENSVVLPKIDLDPASAPSHGFSVGWEVCSLLELTTSPSISQTLRAEKTTFGSITNKVKIERSSNDIIEIEPKRTTLPSAASEHASAGIPNIGENANWWIGNIDTEIAVEIPSINEEEAKWQVGGVLTDIPANTVYQVGETWYINGQNTKEPVKDGVSIELNDDGKWCVIEAEKEPRVLDTVVEAYYSITDRGEWQIGDTVTSILAEVPFVNEEGNWQVGDAVVSTDTKAIPDTEVFEPVSIKLDTLTKVASGTIEGSTTTMQMKIFKEEPPKLVELEGLDEVLTPISLVGKQAVDLEANSAIVKLNNQWTQVDAQVSLWNTTSGISKNPRAIQLSFMIPEERDIFGIFSIYLATDKSSTDAGLFIEVPAEFGPYSDIISIYNYGYDVDSADGDIAFSWWENGVVNEVDSKAVEPRLMLRAGLNCIKVAKSCSILIKAVEGAVGNILYDSLKLVKGKSTHGINLALLDPDMTYSNTIDNDMKKAMAKKVLAKINALDKNHEFYYNVPTESSLAIEFDDNISSFSNPHTLYDINNINNSFVVSKLDVNYLESGLKIANSSKSFGY